MSSICGNHFATQSFGRPKWSSRNLTEAHKDPKVKFWKIWKWRSCNLLRNMYMQMQGPLQKAFHLHISGFHIQNASVGHAQACPNYIQAIYQVTNVWPVFLDNEQALIAAGIGLKYITFHILAMHSSHSHGSSYLFPYLWPYVHKISWNVDSYSKYVPSMCISCVINLLLSLLSLDIDECVLGLGSCPINAICTNTFGSYICQCNIGFQGDGRSCTGL